MDVSGPPGGANRRDAGLDARDSIRLGVLIE
jgi:hypothetical protein